MAAESDLNLKGRLVRWLRPGPPPFLLVALLCSVAVQPYLAASFPSSADGKLHLYRLIELHHAIRNGYFFPRWAPDLVYGYGFPLFNYYAPLPYYLGVLFHLFGLSYQLATQATFVALILLAGWATYRWVGDLFGPAAGVVGAAAYVYMPYVGHLTTHRGALGEVAGLALMPLILWAFTRLAASVTRGRFVLASISLGALLLSHNLTSLLFAPVLLVALLLLWLSGERTRRRAAALAGAVAVGLALGAVFWLPALAERHMIQIDRLFGPAAFDFRLHFLTLKQLLTPPPPFDPNQLRQPFPPALGLPQVALALVAIWGLARGRWPSTHRTLVGAALVGAFLLLLLNLPLSLPLWEAFAILRFVQFPWRLLGPAGLLLALLAGAGVSALPLDDRSVARSLAATIAVLAVTLYGLWWLFGDYEPPLVARTVQDIHRFEIDNNAAGTTSFADYLPTTVAEIPPPERLQGRYAESDVISRLSVDDLPEDTEVIWQRAGVYWARARVDSPVPFTATFDWFVFPGWQATIDGGPAAIATSQPHGLIQVEMPSGRHNVTIRFRLTPVRLAARLTSLFAVLALMGIGYSLPTESARRQSRPQPSWRDAWPTAAILLLLVAKVAYLNHSESFYRRSRFDGGAVRGIDAQAYVRFEGQLVYLGHETATGEVVAGDPLDVTFYWGPQGALDADYSTSAILTDPVGNVIAQADSQHPGDLPTSRWKLHEYAADLHRLTIPADTPPGTYELRTSAYYTLDADTQPLAILDEAGNPVATTLPVTQIEVRRPALSPDPAQISVEHRLETLLTPALELVGYNLSARAAEPGQSLRIDLVWHAAQSIDADLTASLSLDDAILLAQLPLVAETYPTSRWPAGEVVRGRHQLPLPRDLPGGTYTLSLSVEGGDDISLGQVTIAEPPPPVFQPPPMTAELGLDWADGVTLLGYDLPETELTSGDPLDFTLYWQASAEPQASYKVFVHLVDADGAIQAQRDRLPADWARPTTTWRAGEIVADTYAFPTGDLPPGSYTIRVGLYDERTLARLPLADTDSLALDLVEIHLAPS